MEGFIIIVLIILNIILFYLYNIEKNKNNNIEELNFNIKEENKKIEKENEILLKQQKILSENYNQKQKELIEIQKTIENSEIISKKAFDHY